jgi:hypothetical protein
LQINCISRKNFYNFTYFCFRYSPDTSASNAGRGEGNGFNRHNAGGVTGNYSASISRRRCQTGPHGKKTRQRVGKPAQSPRLWSYCPQRQPSSGDYFSTSLAAELGSRALPF